MGRQRILTLKEGLCDCFDIGGVVQDLPCEVVQPSLRRRQLVVGSPTSRVRVLSVDAEHSRRDVEHAVDISRLAHSSRQLLQRWRLIMIPLTPGSSLVNEVSSLMLP